MGLGVWGLIVCLAGGAVSPHFHPLELSRAALPITFASNTPSPSASWRLVPKGDQQFGGIPFRVDARIAVTGLTDARNGAFYPAVRRVSVGRKAARLHVLLGAEYEEKTGIPLATLVLHYADGSDHSFRVAQGIHVDTWVQERRSGGSGNGGSGNGGGGPDPLLDPSSALAWSSAAEDPDGSGNRVRLYRTVFENPRPDHELAYLEWQSLFSRATPFVCGITLDTAPPASPLPVTSSRVVRKSLELPDAVYHQHLVFRVRDAQSEAVLTNATAALTLVDEESSFYFGGALADATGVLRVPFPPQQTLSFSALVRAPGRVPSVVTSTMTNGQPLQREFDVRLARGTPLGGVVQDSQGQPVSGAEVSLFRVFPSGPREYTRIDHETLRTGEDGRWSSESVPTGFTNLFVALSHPALRGRVYRQAGGNGRDIVSTEALSTSRAVLVMPPPLTVTGTVVNTSGEALAGAAVRLLDGNRTETAAAVTDAEGRFSMRASQEGESWLSVSAPGHALRTQQLQIENELAPLQLRLVKAQPFRGRVVDQNRQPVAGARVRYEDRNGANAVSWQTFTDDSGRFVWDTPPENDVMFFVSATNYSSSRISFGSSSGEQLIQLRKQSRVIGRVVDADTGKPLEEFQVLRGRSYNYDEPIRWDRYDSVRGRKGAFSMRLEEYSNGRSQVLVECPGYAPQASPLYSKPGVYTNEFRMQKGRGISGVVQMPDGTPVPGVTVALVDSGEMVSMERPGELRRSSSGPAFQRSTPAGRFEFPPKYDPSMIVAVTDAGYAQMSASNVQATGKLVLQPWGRIRGVLRVGSAGVGPERMVRLQSAGRYEEGGRVYPALDLMLPTTPDASGNFVFEKVPPGERKVYLHYRLGERESGRIALSHGVPVKVEAGKTAEVRVGGTGRPVVGRVVPVGADPQDLDWHRDVQQMSTLLRAPSSAAPPTITPDMTEEQQQEAYREYNQRQSAYWRTPEGRKLQSEQRTYVLLFETNGTFRVENVEPGEYSIYFHITNPERGLNYYETIGSQSVQVTVPEGKSDEPYNVGEHKVQIRGMMRLGRRAPRFEAKAFDGKTVKLDDFQGKYVLLDFWASWAGARSLDVRMLKEVNETYGKDPRFALVGLNFDPERKDAERMIQQNALKWLQCYMGNWGATELPGSFGVQGLPEALLIDPEGKIVARNLRGSNIRNTVRNQLGPAQSN